MLQQIKTTIKLKDLGNNFKDESNTFGSVTSYDGKLNIRPAFQREFVYKDKQRDAVIETILGGYDLGKATWGENNSDYEVIDGQQRTISICQFMNHEYSIKWNNRDVYYPEGLTAEEKEQFDNYEIDVVICIGTQSDKLEWFRRVNIAGEKLTEQELRNATYPSTWLEDAKRYFSKPRCNAEKLYSKYLKGTPIRQDYLETVFTWASEVENVSIDGYMCKHQTDNNAQELINYIEKVFAWVEMLFPNYHKEMCGLNWGELYNKYYRNYYSEADKQSIANKVEELYIDEDVTNYKGVYEYILSGCDIDKVYLLSIRQFDKTIRQIAYARQSGRCICCGEKFNIEELEAHHRVKWSLGGKTTEDNCDMICPKCHKRKLH